MTQWWGPRTSTIRGCELDGGRAGKWRGQSTCAVPDGTDLSHAGAFREVKEPERLVFRPTPRTTTASVRLESVTTVTFAEQNGKTKLTMHASGSASRSAARKCWRAWTAGWNGSARQAGGAGRARSLRQSAERVGHVAQTVFPSVVVVLHEGADRALRKRHAVRARGRRPRGRDLKRQLQENLADRKVPGAARRRQGSHDPEVEHHHRVSGPALSRTNDVSADDAELARQARFRDRFFDLHVHVPMQKVVTDKLRPPERTTRMASKTRRRCCAPRSA